ncbi:Protein NLP1 [Camellia lanceoleosa]|uniref:Protein NLP1 n=1 Tax=Camellia lanceoleosa TaxID=1840588 RepID=A0ACC0G5E7_9ERIC|nr:Protein NLP1 [Camellia lanceoleosa]
MTQSLSCSGEFISQDCSLVEERSVEIMVEVDATNNGAHGVKAYENFPIVSHSEKKNTRDKLKRSYKSISVITREDLEQNFGSSREDVANNFGISVSTMKRICRKHGISRWPFQPERKKERLMEIISPSIHEKHDSRLRCIQTPLHARSSPRTIALLDGGEMVQLDSSKQQSLVEFDITNNSAHLVRASQSCSTISHSDETNSRETLKRKCTTESVLSFEDLQQHFCKCDNAGKALGVSVSTVKRTCRQHGIPRWPSRQKKTVSKTDCMLLEPQGENDVSRTCSKMPTDGQTERGNEMVGHLQDQNEGPNLSNTENGSNKESITTLIFQDSVPGNYPAMNLSISSTHRESGEAGIFSELTFRLKGLTPLKSITHYPTLLSKMDCILLEPEGEKNVSPTYKTPTVGIVLDFKEGPYLSNIENHSNEESTTAHTFQDSVPVFKRDCILLEPQGEKNASPTHSTPTSGETEVGNGMVGHIQDQNGIVPEFIESPNLSNTENCSNEKSLTIPNFQDSVPGNYPATDFSISSTYRESAEAGGSSELAFQSNELTPLMAYPNPNACVFTQPHISLREMPIENVGSSRDPRNFSTSAVGSNKLEQLDGEHGNSDAKDDVEVAGDETHDVAVEEEVAAVQRNKVSLSGANASEGVKVGSYPSIVVESVSECGGNTKEAEVHKSRAEADGLLVTQRFKGSGKEDKVEKVITPGYMNSLSGEAIHRPGINIETHNSCLVDQAQGRNFPTLSGAQSGGLLSNRGSKSNRAQSQIRALGVVGSGKGKRRGIVSQKQRIVSRDGGSSSMANWHKGPAFRVAASVLSRSKSLGQGSSKNNDLIVAAVETVNLGKVLGIDFLGNEEEAVRRIVELEVEDASKVAHVANGV